MRYLIQRIVHNELQWNGPSIGRRGSKIDPGYLEEHGFGHEDWNFSKDVAKDGRVHGYAYFSPKDWSDTFNIAFVTYDKGGMWSLAGWYIKAKFEEFGPQYSDAILKRRARELVNLKSTGDLGGNYERLGEAALTKLLRKETQAFYHWSVTATNAHAMVGPIVIPPKFRPTNLSSHFARPCDVSSHEFSRLISIASSVADKEHADDYLDGGEIEFPEGKKQQRAHLQRERSAKLVKLVKTLFKQQHGRLYCEACEFDFEQCYGQVGVDFIEAHHLVPVHELVRGSKTKPSDMALVCSNCHRMLHRRRPWMKISELQTLLKQRGAMHH
jgi:5-methylcytosine-specific restriction protein A